MEKDYSVIGIHALRDAVGIYVYCNHSQPCPAGLNIGLINKAMWIKLPEWRKSPDILDERYIKREVSEWMGRLEQR